MSVTQSRPFRQGYSSAEGHLSDSKRIRSFKIPKWNLKSKILVARSVRPDWSRAGISAMVGGRRYPTFSGRQEFTSVRPTTGVDTIPHTARSSADLAIPDEVRLLVSLCKRELQATEVWLFGRTNAQRGPDHCAGKTRRTGSKEAGGLRAIPEAEYSDCRYRGER